MSVEDWEAKMVDSCNRSLRTALHKNVVEQSNCDSATRTLDAQKRWVHSRLTKEEREVRQQLQLLQLEQKHLSEQPASSATDAVTDPSTVGMESGFPDPDEVINPYPITSRLKHNNSSGTGNHNDSGTGVSGGGGVRTPRNVTADQQQEPMGGGGRMWVGDLEAISSIRRGLKPPCRQRIDQQQIWARSKSLKERPQSSALNRCFAMSRSRSLRNPSGKAQPSPTSSELGSPRGSVPCSRSGSLKGGMSSSPRKSEPCPVIDPSILRRSLSLKAKLSSSFACSRDVQSGVDLESNAIDAPHSMVDVGIHSFLIPRPRLSTPNLAIISDLVPLPPITVSADSLPSCHAVASYAPNGSNDSPECQSRSRQTAKVTLALRTSLSPSGKCDAARVGSAGGAGLK